MIEDTALPRAYAPFRQVLSLLSAPLATLLSGQLTQFEQLVRDLEVQEFAFHGEFEGLGGLTHHGVIDHILQSELLLRTEAPLEFLRRMVESETLYHERIFADPGKQQVWRAAISVGPGLLGHGRILALAALFFLARIAAQRGGEFHWCFLPRKEGAVWFDQLSINTIKRFLRSASFREASQGDIAAAHKAWAGLTGVRSDKRVQDFSDWVIGASSPHVSSRHDGPAVLFARNALTFALHPPFRTEPRQAEITIRRHTRLAKHAVISFADDQLCLSALEKPFPTPRPETAMPSQLGDTVPDMAGWEPNYLSAPTGLFRLVRLRDGLLIIECNKGVIGSKFLPMPADAVLVGTAIRKELAVLLHLVRDGTQVLQYGHFPLDMGKLSGPSFRREHSVPCSHLFKGAGHYALPVLTSIGDGTEFYSKSGLAYRLGFGRDETDTTFTALHNAKCTLLATGMHQIVGRMLENKPVLTVMKRHNSLVGTFALPNCNELPKSFHGIAWWSSDTSLAYSVRRGSWSVAPVKDWYPDRYRDTELDFEVAPCERVIAAGIGKNGLWARIWSDARYGGEGTVELVNLADGKRRRLLPPLPLGKHAATVCTLIQTHDGYWAVALGANDDLEYLIQYRQNKHSGSVKSNSIMTSELRARATHLDWGDGA